MTNRPAFLERLRVRRGRRLLTAARLRRNESGSAAVEFAIVAPFFFFLMFVIAETALVFVAEQVMDNAVFESARLIRTGQAQNGDFSTADFKDDVCGRMSVFVNCVDGAFYLDVDSYENFADMVITPPLDDEEEFEAPGEYEFGAESEIVVVRAYYQWPINPIMGLQWSNAMTNGKMLIGSFAAFRNEPFGATD